jgi:hypothetical protein
MAPHPPPSWYLTTNSTNTTAMEQRAAGKWASNYADPVIRRHLLFTIKTVPLW